MSLGSLQCSLGFGQIHLLAYMSLVSQDPELLGLGTLYEIQQNDDIGLGVYILAMYKVLLWNYILVSLMAISGISLQIKPTLIHAMLLVAFPGL